MPSKVGTPQVHFLLAPSSLHWGALMEWVLVGAGGCWRVLVRAGGRWPRCLSHSPPAVSWPSPPLLAGLDAPYLLALLVAHSHADVAEFLLNPPLPVHAQSQ